MVRVSGTSVASLVLVLVAAAAGCASVTDEERAARVDALFAPWDRQGSPGCVCAVLRDGTTIYAKGFGAADLSRNLPLTPDSVFDLASTTKQFTGASIALLVAENRVSLDDDVRKHVPELPDYGARVTVADLLHHTSGLRDYPALTYLAGRRGSEPMSNGEVIEILARQKSLNFPPGERFLYSNSNYVLLAEIVQRVSGRALPQLAEERLFAPLQMASTGIRSERLSAVLVTSYRQSDDGSTLIVSTDESSTYGDGSMFSTVRDLARWDENFYTAAVGGSAMLDLMRTRGELSSGARSDYGFGLQLAEYRGVPIELHGGASLGFRTELLRFPSEHFSVAVLCNTAAADASKLAFDVADIYLDDVLAPRDEATLTMPPVQASVDPQLFDAYAGEYSVPAGSSHYVLTLARRDDRFFAQRPGMPPLQIVAVSETEFVVSGANGRLMFHREPDGTVQRLTLAQPGSTKEATRIVSTSEHSVPLPEFAGDYRSDELQTNWHLDLEDDRLVARDGRGNRLPLVVRGVDRFALPGDGQVAFEVADDGRVRGFKVSLGRAFDVEFTRQL